MGRRIVVSGVRAFLGTTYAVLGYGGLEVRSTDAMTGIARVVGDVLVRTEGGEGVLVRPAVLL